ncbi:MAG: hypothetical protein FWC89_04215 [Defluviitaleaceae bacterium]|nr:hypothetical protein [Defluviitaleaceae bacterium]
MGKIQCECGNELSDSVQGASNRARFIAEQDLFDFLDEIESECPRIAPSKTWRYFGDIFQCFDCNNIIIFSNGCYRDFRPIEKAESANILTSQVGKKVT